MLQISLEVAMIEHETEKGRRGFNDVQKRISELNRVQEG